MSDAVKLFRTHAGWIAETADDYFQVPAARWGALTGRDDLAAYLAKSAETWTPADPSALDHLLPPIEQQEVWAAGVTYFRSRTARMEESKVSAGSQFYDLVYNAQRPELFFKAAPWRVVGPGGSVRIRRDATWNVPEPELALLVSPAGRITGYTIGNDMSSRDIEGENPLYLPQAKVYDGSCAIGPCVLVRQQPPSPACGIHLEIRRGEALAFRASTTLAEMKRDFQTLVEYLYKETSFPDGCVLLTGTGIVPPDDFTLQQGDEIAITVDEVGTLHNTVTC
jgi:2-dehydro-3-deoxy-D-arabinonate dehydratase